MINVERLVRQVMPTQTQAKIEMAVFWKVRQHETVSYTSDTGYWTAAEQFMTERELQAMDKLIARKQIKWNKKRHTYVINRSKKLLGGFEQ